MQPGAACMGCHSNHTIMGTVYPSNGGSEATNCIGIPNVQVIITPSSGSAVTLTTNSSGNYYGAASTPYTAKIVYNGVTKAMTASQTSGNCNSCHTSAGAQGAAGRITVP
jgi:hypothetical protein